VKASNVYPERLTVVAIVSCLLSQILLHRSLNLKNSYLRLLPKVREWHGLPWGFPGQPAPLSVETRTRKPGCGFLQVHLFVWQVLTQHIAGIVNSKYICHFCLE
jgi:hypothetical protein